VSATRRIWKFVLTKPLVEIDMPLAARIVHVGLDPAGPDPALWAECWISELRETERRTFRVVATGGPVPDDCAYLGTCHMDEMVWHVFEART
jgi:hypothetical protein